MNKIPSYKEFLNESKEQELNVDELSLDILLDMIKNSTLNLPSLENADSTRKLRIGQDEQLKQYQDLYKKLYGSKGKIKLTREKFAIKGEIINNPKFDKWYKEQREMLANHYK